jgi:hypothetical protein
MFSGMSDSKVSFRSRIAALEPGETVSESQRFALGFVTNEDMRNSIERLRNFANPGVQAAKQKTGGEYVVENGDFRTRSYDIIATVAVTRTR